MSKYTAVKKKNKKFYPERRRRVFVGLSGGVDSSVAAYLLLKEGYEVIGVHMRCWNEGGCDVEEAEYARRVAEHLNIPFYLFDLEKEYKQAVVDYMIKGYKEGVTPNPDVMCNKEIKFGVFLKKAVELGADYVATGHYVLKTTSYKLQTARDASKDQSYFLWALAQSQLKHSLFPIGDYLKKDVRKIAKKIGLPTADKKDSQGICFIGQVSIKDFLKRYIEEKKGNIADEDGKVLGQHEGVQFYTIGQRHGLGIGGSDEPYYVKDKNVKKNELIVAKGDENPALFRKEINLAQVNLVNIKNVPKKGLKVMARVRYRQPLFSATLYKASVKSCKLVFVKPQKFIAPGQSAVFYSAKGVMLGGGVIL